MTFSKLWLSLAVAAVFLTTVAPGVSHAQTKTLRFNAWLPAKHNVQGGVLKEWAQEVEKVTSGRVKIEYTASSLGAPPRQFDLAAEGIADLVLGVHGNTPARFTLTQIVEMPFLGNSGEAISAAYWRVHEKMLAAANEHKGVKVLALWGHGPGILANSARPVSKVDDMRGMKVRVAGGLMLDIASTLGAVPITAPTPQIFEILSRGVADGVFFTSEGIAAFNLQRTVKYVTEVPGGLFNTSFFLGMNQAKWDSLSKEDQAAIMKISGEKLSRAAGASYDALDRDAASRLKAEGIQVITADDQFIADLKERLKSVETKWVAAAKERGVDGDQALKMLREEVAKSK